MLPGSLESIQGLVSSEKTCSTETPSNDYCPTEVLDVAVTCENVDIHFKHLVRIDASQLLQQMLPVDRKHAFWETQPVEQYQDRERETEEEGPIAPPQSVMVIRTEPYRLPKHYEWCTCDLNCLRTMNEIHNLLSNHYVEDLESMFRYNYPKDFLQRALRPPGYFPSWHIGVRVEATKRLVAFITGVPVKMRLHSACLPMAEVNFLCIHKKLRSKRLAPLLIKEITRRVHLENVWQAVYTAGVVLPTPLVTCQYWHRPLNPKKLINSALPGNDNGSHNQTLPIATEDRYPWL
ncbi:hypothetical protein L7F22_006282 [Adiantum nelumboides]|nr:hypothetical protein [Adiantum nelumboides]